MSQATGRAGSYSIGAVLINSIVSVSLVPMNSFRGGTADAHVKIPIYWELTSIEGSLFQIWSRYEHIMYTCFAYSQEFRRFTIWFIQPHFFQSSLNMHDACLEQTFTRDLKKI